MNTRYSPDAQKYLTKIDKKAASRIVQKINDIAQQKASTDAKRLTGVNASRIRIGNYRVIYRNDIDKNVLIIIKIAHRSKAYKNLQFE